MNKFAGALLLGLLLVGCGSVSLPSSSPEQTPTQAFITRIVLATATNTPTAMPTSTSTATQVPSATATKAAPTVRVSALSLQSATCSLTNNGVQLVVDKRVSADWRWDPNAIDSNLKGCSFLAEGRKVLTEEHHVWVIGKQTLMYLDSDNLFHCRECSVWVYPAGWNMDDFSTTKQPIAAEFANAKANNMKANNYSWPIFVHLADGASTVQFKAGVMVNNVTLPNNCSFDAPQRHKITGIYDPSNGSFNASIGAEGCKTIAWINGSTAPILWDGAKDNVGFNTIIAYLIPKGWTNDQINAFAATSPK